MNEGDVLRAVVISLCALFGSALAAMMIVATRRKTRTLVQDVPLELQVAFVFAYTLLYVVLALGRWVDIGDPISGVTVFSLMVMIVNAIVIWVIVKEERPKGK